MVVTMSRKIRRLYCQQPQRALKRSGTPACINVQQVNGKKVYDKCYNVSFPNDMSDPFVSPKTQIDAIGSDIFYSTYCSSECNALLSGVLPSEAACFNSSWAVLKTNNEI